MHPPTFLQVVQFAAYEWIMARVLAANARTAGGRRPLPPAASQARVVSPAPSQQLS